MGQVKLRRKQLLLCVENSEIGSIAAVVLQLGQPLVFLVRLDKPLLGLELSSQLLADNQSVFHIGKGILDRRFIAEERSPLRRFSLLHLARNRARRKPVIDTLRKF